MCTTRSRIRRARGRAVIAGLALAALAAASPSARAAGAAPSHDVERILEERMDFEFADLLFPEAVLFIGEAARVSVVLGPEARAAKGGARVTAGAAGEPLRAVLERVLGPLGLEHTVRDEAVFVHAKGRPGRRAAGGRPKAPGDLGRRLGGRVAFEFVDAPFAEAVDRLRVLGGVKVVLPAEVAERHRAQRVTLKVHDMTFGAALGWIAELAGLECAVEGDSLRLVEPAPAAAPLKFTDAFPVAIVVIEFARPSDVREARELLEYLTRDRHTGRDPAKTTFGCFRFLPSRTLASARADAAKHDAFAIVGLKFGQNVRSGGSIRRRVSGITATFYGSSPFSRESPFAWIGWSTLPVGQTVPVELARDGKADDGDRPSDAPEIRAIGRDILTQLRDMAVRALDLDLVRLPGGGRALRLTLSNSTNCLAAEIRFSTSLGGGPWTYAGDPVPPGMRSVSIPLTDAEADVLAGRHLQPSIVSIRFGVPAGEEGKAPAGPEGAKPR